MTSIADLIRMEHLATGRASGDSPPDMSAHLYHLDITDDDQSAFASLRARKMSPLRHRAVVAPEYWTPDPWSYLSGRYLGKLLKRAAPAAMHVISEYNARKPFFRAWFAMGSILPFVHLVRVRSEGPGTALVKAGPPGGDPDAEILAAGVRDLVDLFLAAGASPRGFLRSGILILGFPGDKKLCAIVLSVAQSAGVLLRYPSLPMSTMATDGETVVISPINAYMLIWNTWVLDPYSNYPQHTSVIIDLFNKGFAVAFPDMACIDLRRGVQLPATYVYATMKVEVESLGKYPSWGKGRIEPSGKYALSKHLSKLIHDASFELLVTPAQNIDLLRDLWNPNWRRDAAAARRVFLDNVVRIVNATAAGYDPPLCRRLNLRDPGDRAAFFSRAPAAVARSSLTPAAVAASLLPALRHPKFPSCNIFSTANLWIFLRVECPDDPDVVGIAAGEPPEVWRRLDEVAHEYVRVAKKAVQWWGLTADYEPLAPLTPEDHDALIGKWFASSSTVIQRLSQSAQNVHFEYDQTKLYASNGAKRSPRVLS